MAYLYAVNPRRRRRTRSAATRRRRRAARRAPARRAYARRARPRTISGVVYVNPRRRRRRRRYASLPMIVRRNPRRRYDGGGRSHKIENMLLEGAGGAVGGILVDIATGLVPLPSFLSSGLGLAATKTALAVGVGYGAEKFWRGSGPGIAAGTVAVALHEYLAGLVGSMFPSLTSGTTQGTLQQLPAPAYYAPVAGQIPAGAGFGVLQPGGVNPNTWVPEYVPQG
jgi:hypothetical protein